MAYSGWSLRHCFRVVDGDEIDDKEETAGRGCGHTDQLPGGLSGTACMVQSESPALWNFFYSREGNLDFHLGFM